MSRIFSFFFIAFSLFILTNFISCKPKENKEEVGAYVGNKEKGLSKKQTIDSNDILCQLIPDKIENEKKGSNFYKFNVYLNTKLSKMTDSTFYFFNYHSEDLFALVLGTDTIKPVLSERIANGRKDLNQFTVLFDIDKKVKIDSNINLIIRKNGILENGTSFSFSNNNFKKALKQLYGYDQNND
jgi:hypothetical protein